MKSCWILRYKNGEIKLLTEQEYKGTIINTDDLLYEEHWFDVTKAKDKYRNELEGTLWRISINGEDIKGDRGVISAPSPSVALDKAYKRVGPMLSPSDNMGVKRIER